jgi:hypothetical protein
MKLAKLKKQIEKSKLWASISEELKKDIPDEEKLFLESVVDVLEYNINDIVQMWAFTHPQDREAVRQSLQKMMDDKISGTLHKDEKDKEWYRQYGIKKAEEIATQTAKEIDEMTKTQCTPCNGTGKLSEKVICLACGGTGKTKSFDDKILV